MPTCAPAEKAALMAYEIAAALEPPKPSGMMKSALNNYPRIGVRGLWHLTICKVGLGVQP